MNTASRYYSHAGQMVAVRTGNSNAELFSLVADHQGTVHHQVRNSDSQLQTTWQNPYGNRRGTAPSSWRGQRGFVGGVNDVSTGLVRLGARDFDPTLQAVHHCGSGPGVGCAVAVEPVPVRRPPWCPRPIPNPPDGPAPTQAAPSFKPPLRLHAPAHQSPLQLTSFRC